MIFYLTLIVSLLFLVHFYIHGSRRGKIVNRVPGPPVVPILGNALELNLLPYDFYRKLREYRKAYYPIYRLWLMNTSVISLFHPDDLEILFTSKKHINKDFAYVYLRKWLRSGLITSLGKQWFHRRKILTPAFHFNILKELIKTIVKNANKRVEEMKSQGPEVNVVDLVPFCMELTLNVICESSMGVAVFDDEVKESMAKYKKALHEMVTLLIYRNLRPHLKDWALFLAPDIKKRQETSLRDMDEFMNDIVVQRRQYHEETNFVNLDKLQNDAENFDNESHYDSKKKRLAMLDLLLAAERNNLIDHEGIKDEVSTFIFAGHDTTGIAFCFTTLLFAEHEDIQKRAREEVEQVFQKRDGRLDYSAMNDLKYLERCIKESLRLYPPVPTFARHMTEDLQLKHCLAPKGADVFVQVVDAHRDPNFWPEPAKFDPDRFLPEAVSKRHPFAYVPFSAGSRNCIGQKYAMMELKSIMASILYNFRIEPVDRLCDFEVVADAITRPDRPVKTKFVKIDR